MSWALLSPLLVVAAAGLLMALERRFPHDRNQGYFREGFFNDLVLYTFVQSYLLGHLIKFLIEAMDRGSGLARLHLLSGWPVGLQFLFFLFTHDLYIYLFHRAQHRWWFLWRIHEAHHSTRDVDWLSGSRSHPLEILVNQTIEFAPIALLGASPDVIFMKTAIDAIWGMYIHANLDVRSGPLQYVINGPEMHRWHHAIEITEGGINYATKFACWDWLFGSAYLPRRKPAGYGVQGLDFPRGYLGQVLHAFRARPVLEFGHGHRPQESAGDRPDAGGGADRQRGPRRGRGSLPPGDHHRGAEPDR
jgi:sterol desaturase/sphingolipid hydroxylase (fatty acid hydroxylase superfamily)